MKNNYKKIIPSIVLVASLVQSLVGCASMQTRFEKEESTMKTLGVQRLEDIDSYPEGYQASWRSKGDIREALRSYASKYPTYEKAMTNALGDMDTNDDGLITDYEAENFGK